MINKFGELGRGGIYSHAVYGVKSLCGVEWFRSAAYAIAAAAWLVKHGKNVWVVYKAKEG